MIKLIKRLFRKRYRFEFWQGNEILMCGDSASPIEFILKQGTLYKYVVDKNLKITYIANKNDHLFLNGEAVSLINNCG